PMANYIGWMAEQLDGKSPEFEAELTHQIRQAMAERFLQGLDAFPGALELLTRLHLPFCVATNGPREKVEMTLGLAGLRHLFGNRIFSAYEVGCFKPDPGLFIHAAEVLGVEPCRCAVVEDSLPGIKAGLAAGMKVFALHPRETTSPELAAHIYFIDSLSEFDRLLHM
ncbi:HAD-IA family hydrolase, partial [Malonomonas rubra]|uniref:HAD-IA family hydrolase n=1 Tax=Malonomonas rubra TaxID=57040 RepID=UPI0026EB0BA5